MNAIGRLAKAYERYISLPWQIDAAAAKRVVFCVYDPDDERTLRAMMGEFELTTKESKHGWCLFDITDTFPKWLSGDEYAASYFEDPDNLHDSFLKKSYMEFIKDNLAAILQEKSIGENDVVAIMGVGSLFGFLMVREVAEELSKLFSGKLVVFFPGTHLKDNYRLLDAYDGPNYLAVPITSEMDR
jgi:hypothetical protein